MLVSLCKDVDNVRRMGPQTAEFTLGHSFSPTYRLNPLWLFTDRFT